MKKVLLFVAVVGGLAFTSCSKSDYQCTCTSEFAGVTSTTEATFEGVKEDEAQDACDAFAFTDETCTLKEI